MLSLCLSGRSVRTSHVVVVACRWRQSWVIVAVGEVPVFEHHIESYQCKQNLSSRTYTLELSSVVDRKCYACSSDGTSRE